AQDRAPDDTATAISGDVWFSSENLHTEPRKQR
ncbi:SAM-dependent methyltransferase, partial [Mesorhizobium sp. M7A.F.Ca.CA.001.11.2.1]